MNKKITYVGIILVLMTLAVTSAFAAVTEVTFSGSPVSVTGNPGDSVTISYTANNANSSVAKALAFTSTQLGFSTPVTPTINGVTVPAGGSSTISFPVTIPATLAQGYTGTITATSGSETDTSVSYTITVGSVNKLDVLTFDNATALEIFGEENQNGVTGTFSIKNIGSTVLSGLVFDTANLDLKDRDNDVITLTFSDSGSINPGETKIITMTANYGRNIDLDTYGGIVDVKFGSIVLDTFKLDLKVNPEICTDGIVSDGNKSSRSTADLQVDVREPDSGDDFKPGDSIKIEVKVENDGKDDLDVLVEAILYNLDQDEEVATAESDPEEIKDGNDETFEFDLDVPKDFDGDDNDKYVMFIKVSEDGDEEQNCNFESVNMDFKQNKDDIIVKKANLLPSVARPGEIVELIVDLKNVGSRDQKDAYIKVANSELGINLRSTEFDLDKAGSSDDDITRRFTLSIPPNAVDKDYLIDVGVFDDNDDSYDNGQEFVTLTVKGAGTVNPGGNGKQVNLEVSTQTSEIDASKKTANLHVLFKNNEVRDLSAVIDISTVGGWAEPIASQTVSLHTGDNNLYFNLKLKELEEGTYSAIVNVKPTSSGNFDSRSFTLNFSVVGKSGGNGIDLGNLFGVKTSTVFWIIGDVLLVLVALFFIKAIFFGKKN